MTTALTPLRRARLLAQKSLDRVARDNRMSAPRLSKLERDLINLTPAIARRLSRYFRIAIPPTSLQGNPSGTLRRRPIRVTKKGTPTAPRTAEPPAVGARVGERELA